MYSGNPVDVGITMYVSSVSSISEVDMVCATLMSTVSKYA